MSTLYVLFALSLVVLTTAEPGFPLQGCSPSVCASLDVEPWSELATVDNKFNYSSAYSGNSPGWDDQTDGENRFGTLASYYGKYNMKYNGGKFTEEKWALRDGAPSLNYMAIRTTLGQYDSSGEDIAYCCNTCRETAGCLMYLFNPNVLREPSTMVNGKRVLGKVLGFSGLGDCNLIMVSDNPKNRTDVYTAIVNRITFPDAETFADSKTKPMFFGGKCNPDISDDPHFVGARGTKFDFNGELDKSFCLVTDSRLQLNTVLRGYVDPRAEKGIRSWMKELGFLWIDAENQKHSLFLSARTGAQEERGAGFLSRVVLDGEDMPLLASEGDAINQGLLSLSFVGTRKVGPYELDTFTLTIAGLLDVRLSMRVAHPLLRTPTDSEVHFNVQFNMIQGSERVHGVLGQTYRQTAMQLTKAIEYSILTRILGGPVQADGATGKGFLDGEVDDYVTSSVLDSDCRFSAFGY